LSSTIQLAIQQSLFGSAAWAGCFGVTAREVVLAFSQVERPFPGCCRCLGFAAEYFLKEFLSSGELLVPVVYLFDVFDIVEMMDDVFPDRVHHLYLADEFVAGLGMFFFGAEPLGGWCAGLRFTVCWE